MEGLRHSLLAPAGGTFLMVVGCAQAMKEMVAVRYASKDDNDKPLLPHPYSPWDKVDPKYQDQADKAYRAFKMFENVKEWTFLSLPCMWLSSIYGGSLPYVNQNMVDAVTISSCALYALANHWFVQGYIESPENRIKGFSLRTKVVKFWLFGCGVGIFWSSLQRFGVVG